jgi:hypothetical protein
VEDDVRLAVGRALAARRRLDVAKSRLEESLQQFNDTRALLNDDRAHLGDMAAARFRVAQSQGGVGPGPVGIFDRHLWVEPRRWRAGSICVNQWRKP